jgi:hypothetical protein
MASITLNKIKLHYDIIRLQQVLDVGVEFKSIFKPNYKLSESMCSFIISWLTDENEFRPPDSKIGSLISIFREIKYGYTTPPVCSTLDHISRWQMLTEAIHDHYEILNRLMSAIDIK